MIANYEKKFAYLLRRQGGNCPIAATKKRWAVTPTELHHRCHRVGWAMKKFPLFIDSLWNLMAVNRDWHTQWPSFGKITYEEAERREAFLQRHPLIAAKLNMEEPE